MRRVAAALPWVLLAGALGLGGWIAVDAIGSAREAGRTSDPRAPTTTLPPTTTTTTTTRTTTTTLPITTSSTLHPSGWYDSCENVVAELTAEGFEVSHQAAALTQAVQSARAGATTWADVADTVDGWLIPALETLNASATEVIDADPDAVSVIAARAFQEPARSLQQQAEELVGTIIDPVTGQLDEAAWTQWWDGWSQSVQGLADLLGRAPAMAYNCPD
jgi:hypothetical protein